MNFANVQNQQALGYNGPSMTQAELQERLQWEPMRQPHTEQMSPERKQAVEAIDKIMTPILEALEQGVEPLPGWQEALSATGINSTWGWANARALGAKMIEEYSRRDMVILRFLCTMKDSVQVRHAPFPAPNGGRSKPVAPAQLEELCRLGELRDCFVTCGRIALFRGQRKAARSLLVEAVRKCPELS